MIITLMLLGAPTGHASLGYAREGDGHAVVAAVALEPARLERASILPFGLRASHDLAVAEAPQIDFAIVAAARLRFDSGLYLDLGELRHERFVALGATRQALSPLRAGFRHSLDLGSALRLSGEARLAVSLLQRTQLELGLGSEVRRPFLLCSSGSELALELGALLLETLDLGLEARVTGDPIHLTDGAGCLGNSPVWLGGYALGARTTWWLGDTIGIRGELGATWIASHVDTGSDSTHNPQDEDGHHHGEVVETMVASTRLALGVEVRL